MSTPVDNPRRPRRLALILVLLISLAHALIYVALVPLWQVPDEPMLYEYVALAAELGRVPSVQDRSPALEQRLADSMNRAEFWRYATFSVPDRLPKTFDEILGAFTMPRQVGGDPPIYFILASLPLRLASGWSVEAQVYLLRVLNALLLPAAALCVYQTVRELGAPDDIVPIAAAALVALQPMYTYIGMALSNDGPGNVAAALITLLMVRAIARGLRGRDVALALAVALVTLQIKRTSVPLALLCGGLTALWAARALWAGGGRRETGGAALPPASRLLLAGAALALLLGGGAWLSSQIAWAQADRWYNVTTLFPAARARLDGGYALTLDQGETVTQVLPEVATVYLRNGAVRMGARVWSDGPAVVRLVLDTGIRHQETSFAVNGVADAQTSGPVGSLTSGIRFDIVAERGNLRVSNVWMHGVGLPGELLTNGTMSRPALRSDSPLVTLGRYLRASDLMWVFESGRLRWGLDIGEWLHWLFDSFWGHFGWMRIAVVRGSDWELAIGAMLGAGGVGGLAAFVRLGRGRRWPFVALVGLVGAAVGLLLLNTLGDQYLVQQGRYLFPILPALVIIVSVGQAALIPAQLRLLWLLGWLTFWLALAGFALAQLGRVYG